MNRHLDRSTRRHWLSSLAVALCLVGSPLLAHAELKAPSQQDKRITFMVMGLIKDQHLSRHKLDNEIAERTMSLYFKTLDPLKLYFNQSDRDTFEARRRELVAQIGAGDISMGYDIFKKFIERVDQRVAFADEFLNAQHDFTLEEAMVVDPDKAKYAQDDTEARDLWRRRIKFDLLALKSNDNLTGDEARNKLRRRYHSFAKRIHQTSSDELLENYLTSVTTAYDPHSTYMAPSTLENFEIQMRLELDGIGAQLQSEDGTTVIHKIIPGGAADKDGRLKAKDKIVAVSNGEGQLVETEEMKLQDVVQLIRGKAGTQVRIVALPAGTTERKEYVITRAKIELRDSEARGEVVEQLRDGRTFRVGVIDLPSFYMDMEGARQNKPDYKSTTRDVAKLLEDFKTKRVDAVVLDLRRNGGGSLTEAISLTGLFITEGPIVQVKDKDGRTQAYNDMDRSMLWDGPLVVLISKFSASASEIFAGAIQDYHRGIIVGDKQTHGKGTVQSLLDLSRNLFPNLPNVPSMGALKITMQQFYRPNGDSTQNRGVQADVRWPSLTNELDVAESDLEYALPFDRINEVPFQRVNMVSPQLIAKLTELAAAREKDSPDFKKVYKSIERYHEQKKREAVNLNEQKFLAERAELNSEKEQEKKFEELNNGIKKDFYFNEAVAITLDYVLSLQPSAQRATPQLGKTK